MCHGVKKFYINLFLFFAMLNCVFIFSFLVSEWNHRFKEMVPSTVFPGKYDLPVESVEWLKHFSQQNGSLLKKLDVSI